MLVGSLLLKKRYFPISGKCEFIGLVHAQLAHIAVGGKGYTLHVHTTSDGKGYTLYVHTASDGKGYTLYVHTASDGKDTPCMSILLAMERDTPCMYILLAMERIHPARQNCWQWKVILYCISCTSIDSC
jgi:hypothetical protein